MRDARLEAVLAWADYCQRFGLVPELAAGMSLPGHEKHPMNEGMVREVDDHLRGRRAYT